MVTVDGQDHRYGLHPFLHLTLGRQPTQASAQDASQFGERLADLDAVAGDLDLAQGGLKAAQAFFQHADRPA